MSDIVYKKIGFSTPFLRGFKTLKIPIIDTAGTPTWPEMFLLRANERITALENRTTILETGIGQLQMKIDGIKEDVTLIKSAVIK